VTQQQMQIQLQALEPQKRYDNQDEIYQKLLAANQAINILRKELVEATKTTKQAKVRSQLSCKDSTTNAQIHSNINAHKITHTHTPGNVDGKAGETEK
jgi:hypothetical protein